MSINKKKERGKTALKNTLIYFIIPLALIIFLSWKIGLGFFLLMIIKKVIQVKKRKFLAKDAKGNELSTKQFFSRWKEGIEGITPLQQSKSNLLGTWIVLTGLVAGVVVTCLVRLENIWWWMLIILSGSLFLTIISFIGLVQKYWKFKEMDKIQQKLEEDLKKQMENKDD